MTIDLNQIIPSYMDIEEVAASEVYLKDSIEFRSPLTYLIQARSGRGKTSLFSILYGNLKSFKGKVRIDSKYKDKERWTFGISAVHQDLKLFPELTAWENIIIKNQLTEHRSASEINSWLDRLEMTSKKDQLVGTLSQGQQQRIAIIRALCQPFEFILLDEPFSHLDDQTIASAVHLIDEVRQEENAGLILMSLEDSNTFTFDQKFKL